MPPAPAPDTRSSRRLFKPVAMIDRYLMREISMPFAVGMGLFFAVVAFAQVLKVSDAVTGIGITGGEILEALAYSMPPLMGLLIPVSALFATLLGVGRLASDREIVAMCVGGISPYRLLRVPLAIGVVLACGAAFATVVGEPWGVTGLRVLMQRSAQRAIARGVRVGEFNEWVPGVTFLALGRDGNELTDVVFADRRDDAHPIVISARYGRVEQGRRAADIVFNLTQGEILARDRGAGSDRVIHFERSRYRLDVGTLVRRKARTIASAQGKTMPELWQGSHDPEESASRRALLTIVMHRKVAIPLATLIFALLAVPLACTRTPGARARGFLLSSGIVGAYYYLGRAVELAARGGRFDPVVAAWLPNILGLVGVAVLLWRLRRSAV